jgi:molybdopterin/thiamine biosynthesis adenylyltransferase
MPEKPVIKRNCENEGIMSPVAGVLGTLQANEVLKTILNLKFDLFKKILIFDGLKMEFRKVNLKKNSKCKNRC